MINPAMITPAMFKTLLFGCGCAVTAATATVALTYAGRTVLSSPFQMDIRSTRGSRSRPIPRMRGRGTMSLRA